MDTSEDLEDEDFEGTRKFETNLIKKSGNKYLKKNIKKQLSGVELESFSMEWKKQN